MDTQQVLDYIMKVTLRLFANLKEYAPNKTDEFVLEVENGATVDQVVRKLNIPDDVQRVVLLNGRHAKPDATVAENDGLTLFPPMTGG